MKIAITGASGFIGHRLISRLVTDGHHLHLIGRRQPRRSSDIAFSTWDANANAVPPEALTEAAVVIHLAGEPVAQRWNDKVKARILETRVRGTQALVDSLSKLRNRPHTLLCASAIGFYGSRHDEVLDERSPAGEGFLPEVCIAWEKEARFAEDLGMRVVTLRIGIVLGREGGALKKMIPPFKLGVGGPIGSGKQWMSWVHVDDLVEMIRFCISRPDVSGAVNGTAPNPVRNWEFAEELGNALHRPSLIATPAFAVKLMLGEGASIVLTGQRVLPKVLQTKGFQFQYPELPEALRHAIASR
jgi:uncharacterized protein (TIGR01777 family)